MSELQWHSWTAEDMEPSSTGIWARRSEVEAALGAKDAENRRIRKALNKVLAAAFGKLSQDVWNAAQSALEEDNAPPEPHPDTARLDKLPQCFRMLRTNAGSSGESMPFNRWWLTYDVNTAYNTVREAIDAHQEPKP